MGSWRFWDWVAYACLFIAAIVTATDAALKNAPDINAGMPELVKSEYWAFTPLALLLVSAVIFFTKASRAKHTSKEAFSRAKELSLPQEPRGAMISHENQVTSPDPTSLEHDPAAQGYPHKLCIAVKNESDRDLVVNPARWETRAASDIAVRRINEHPWTPEGPDGWEKRNWIWSRSPGNAPIHVSRGRAIQTWAGLHGAIDDIELTQRIVGKRLGTLLVSFTANGNAGTETIKL